MHQKFCETNCIRNRAINAIMLLKTYLKLDKEADKLAELLVDYLWL